MGLLKIRVLAVQGSLGIIGASGSLAIHNLGSSNVLMAELTGILKSLEQAWDLGFRQLTI